MVEDAGEAGVVRGEEGEEGEEDVADELALHEARMSLPRLVDKHTLAITPARNLL